MEEYSDQKSLVDVLEFLQAPVMAHVFTGLASDPRMRDLSFVELATIMQVFLEGPKTISDIAKQAEITHFSASRVVDRLVRRGIFSRSEDPLDRRSKRVSLTIGGLEYPPIIRLLTRSALQHTLAPVPQLTRSSLEEVLREIKKHLPPVPIPTR